MEDEDSSEKCFRLQRSTYPVPESHFGRVWQEYDRPATYIDEFVYLGSKEADNVEELIGMGICYVLNVADDYTSKDWSIYGIETKCLPMCDKWTATTELHTVMEEAIKFIERGVARKDNVLIHCHGGINRSPTICMAYLMHKYQCSFLHVYEYVKKLRPYIRPAPDYIIQLLQYQKQRWPYGQCYDRKIK